MRNKHLKTGGLLMCKDKKKYVPKLKAEVKILTKNGQITNDYTIFLGIKENSKEAESLSDFLQYEHRLFLPLIHNNNNTFELMNIHNIIYIKENQKSLAEAGKTVTLTLTNNTRLKVKISDFINSKNNFLEFICEDGCNIYINKHKISMLQEKTVY